MEILGEVLNVYLNLNLTCLKSEPSLIIICISLQQQDVNGRNQGEQHKAVSTRGTSAFIFWCILFIAIRFSCHSLPFPDI